MGSTKFCIDCRKRCTARPSSIECSQCLNWIHRRCVPFSPKLMKEWNDPDVRFVCRSCAWIDGEYDVIGAMRRISSKTREDRVTAARGEMLLWKTHDVQLPCARSDDLQHPTDQTAVEILKLFSPATLKTHKPLRISADGNCMFRCVCLGLYGNERYHSLLRLMTAVEVILNSRHYDIDDPNYVDIFKDQRLLFPKYDEFQDSILSDGSFSFLLTVAAASAVTGKTILSYCPPTLNSYFLNEPLSRCVQGRGVKFAAPTLLMMWSMTVVPMNSYDFIPNHFCLLEARSKRCFDFGTVSDEGGVDGGDELEDDRGKRLDNNGDELTNACHEYKDYSEDDDNNTGDDIKVETSQSGGDDDDDDGDDDDDDDDDGDDDDDDDDDDEDGSGGGDLESDNDSNDKNSITSVGNDGGMDERGIRRVGRTDGNNDRYTDDDSHVHITENLSIPLNGTFLDTTKVLEFLQKTADTPLTQIPPGKKDNVAFTVINDENIEKRKQGQRRDFRDDCGQWDKSSTVRFYYILKEGKLIKVFKYGEKICNEMRVKGSRQYVPLEPQPSEVVVIVRYYTILKTQNNYKRRITWVETAPPEFLPPPVLKVALVEYVGTFLRKRIPHGLTIFSERAPDYVRTSKKTMDSIDVNKYMTPMEVYHKLVTEEHVEVSDIPRNKQQIKNKQHYERKKGGQTSSGNLADQVEAILKLSGKFGDFLRKVSVSVIGTKLIPSVVLYTQEQIEDLKSFCFSGKSVLGVDRTFNLGELFVTVSVYKHVALHRKYTTDHPIFIGPLFLHGGATYELYHHFLATLHEALPRNSDTSCLVVGSDDEKALTSAVKAVFPDCKQALCTLHIKKNVARHLNIIGLTMERRKTLVQVLFGKKTSLLESQNDIDFELKKEMIKEMWPKNDVAYLEKICSQIQNHVLKLKWQGLLDGHWTNNNAESINHILKLLVGWKPKQLPLLVEKLRDVVQLQRKELERALISRGEFELIPILAHFKMTADKWLTLASEQKNKLTSKLRKAVSSNKVQSSQGTLLIDATPSKSKKPNQKKRNKASRTTTMTKRLKVQ